MISYVVNFGRLLTRVMAYFTIASGFTFFLGFSAAVQAQECSVRKMDSGGRSNEIAQSNFTCLTARLTATLSRIETLEAEMAPFRNAKGAVIAFDRSEEDACPRGWRKFQPASGRFIVGAGVNTNFDQNGVELTDYPSLIDDDAKAVGGEERVTLVEGETPNHSHGFESALVGTQLPWGDSNHAVPTTVYSPNHKKDFSFGGGKPHNNLPPFVALFYCQKI